MNQTAPFVLAVDVGTSTLKSVLYDRNGQTLAVATGRYEYHAPHSGWAEADPEDWWDALVQSLQQLRLKGYDLDGLSFIAVTGQMHTVVLLDQNGVALPPTILWLDRRAAAETAELQQKLNLPPYQLNSTYSLPRLLWLSRNQPHVIRQTRHILWPKDYIRYRLTGVFMTDRTEAGGAALLDWETLEWAEERLIDLGFDPQVLPPFGEATDSCGPVRADIAGQLGLSPQVQVLVGVGDVLALVTAAPPLPGRVTCSLGSSSMIFYPMVDGQNYSDPQGRIYEYPLLPYRMLGGVSSTSGSALYWAYQTLYGAEKPYEAVIQEALETEPGCDGLVFMPFLSGERSPFWSDTLSGGFYGLRLSHTRPQMIRSVMEGVAFSLRYLIDIYLELGVPVDHIALAGGGAAVPGWPQIFTDVCHFPASIYAGQETVTHGLYAYACLAAGETSFSDALGRTFQPPKTVIPNPKHKDIYDRIYKQYCALVNFASQTLAEQSTEIII